MQLQSGCEARVGHERCPGSGDHFQISECAMYLEGRLAATSQFDDRKVDEWVRWCRSHQYLNMRIVKQKTSIEGVRVVGVNPFDAGCRVSILGGPTVPARLIKSAAMCGSCGTTSRAVHRCRPDSPWRGQLDFVPRGYRGRCYVCGDVISRAVDEGAFRGGIKRYLEGSERCLLV